MHLPWEVIVVFSLGRWFWSGGFPAADSFVCLIINGKCSRLLNLGLCDLVFLLLIVISGLLNLTGVVTLCKSLGLQSTNLCDAFGVLFRLQCTQ